MSGDTVVLGVGNVLAGDDGVGPRVIEALVDAVAHGRATLPDGTRLLDGGTAGIGLLPTIRGSRRLVVVDATAPAGSPGRVTVGRGTAVAGAGAVAELLRTAAFAGSGPSEVTLVGVEGASLRPGADLTPRVAAAVAAAAGAVLDELWGRGGMAR